MKKDLKTVMVNFNKIKAIKYAETLDRVPPASCENWKKNCGNIDKLLFGRCQIYQIFYRTIGSVLSSSIHKWTGTPFTTLVQAHPAVKTKSPSNWNKKYLKSILTSKVVLICMRTSCQINEFSTDMKFRTNNKKKSCFNL